MRSKLLIVLFGAAAFFCAFFAVTREAAAATTEGVDEVATVSSGAPASPAPHANLAQPGTYAAKFGAPLCDDRGASAYAAEPKPAPVDGGEVAVGASSAGEKCSTTAGGALFKPSCDGSPSQNDDLQRTPPVARDVAILPEMIDVTAVVALDAMPRAEVDDGAREGFGPHDNPPPRPIPWRS